MQSVKISLSSSSPEIPPEPCSGLAVRTFPVRPRNSRLSAVPLFSPPSLPWEQALSQAMLYFLITPGIQEIGEMVGLNSVELERALCSRTMETGKEKVVTALNVVQVRGPVGGG